MAAAVALTEMTTLCVQVVETPWRILNFKVVQTSMPKRYDLRPPCMTYAHLANGCMSTHNFELLKS
jgi:hypothetical protein